jgi:plasmid stability protein
LAALQVNVPERVKERLAARAAESGYKSVEQYARALLQANAEEDVIDDDLEALLIERLKDRRPGIAFTVAFKRQFRAEIKKRRKSRGN